MVSRPVCPSPLGTGPPPVIETDVEFWNHTGTLARAVTRPRSRASPVIQETDVVRSLIA